MNLTRVEILKQQYNISLVLINKVKNVQIPPCLTSILINYKKKLFVYEKISL